MTKKLEQLKKVRKQKNLTQQQMADSIGVSLSMYEKVERGYIKASRNFMDAFKNKYPNINVDSIFFN